MAKNVLDTFTPETCPKWDAPLSLLNPKNPDLSALRKACKGMDTVPKNAQEALERQQKVAWSLHPETGIPRAMLVWLRLEELALVGDSKAMAIYIDRAFGKVPEQLTVKLGQWEGKSDDELLKVFAASGSEAAVMRLLKFADGHLTDGDQNHGKIRNSAKRSLVRVVENNDNSQGQAIK